MKKRHESFYHAAIRLDGEDLFADFPEFEAITSDEQDAQWLEDAKESVMEWMDSHREHLPIAPKRLCLKRGEKLFELPVS
jgi:hypothetical protein